MTSTEPFVTVVVATRNRAPLLRETLDALVAQRWTDGRGEIIVADNASTDDTRAVVEAAASAPGPTIRYLHVKHPGKSHAVNAALAQARGDPLVFTDDDVVPEPEWLERMVQSFTDTGVEFAAGRILPRWETTPPAWLSPRLYGPLAIPDNGLERRAIGAGGTADVIPIGANMAVRRRVIERLGGLRADLGKLDGTFRTGEDHEFFLRMRRAGCLGIYEPTAVVHHWVPRSRLRREYCRRWLYQNGRDVARLDLEYTPGGRRLARVPLYLWRQAVSDAARAAASTNMSTRVASTMRLAWFAGYVRQSWLGSPGQTMTSVDPV